MSSVALVADDNALFRLAVATLLKHECAIKSVFETDTLETIQDLLRAQREISLVVIDPFMTGVESIAGLHHIRSMRPDVRIVVLTETVDRNYVFEALAAGAHGFVRKTAPLGIITAAIRHVMGGQIYLPPETATFDVSPSAAKSAPCQATIERLTPRQLEIVGYLRDGASNKQIARRLGLSESTVKVHANAAYRVLGIRDRREIAEAVTLPFRDAPGHPTAFSSGISNTSKTKAPVH